ncbi:MFS transporter [Actinomycetes bacterium KLBMP 9759]
MTTSRTVFPVYAAAECLSFFGNAAIQIVLPWLVLLRTGDPAAAGLVAGVAGVAQVLATFSVGRLIDRFGARRMAVFADAGSALSVAALAVVDTTFGLDLGWMIGLAVAGALFDIPGMTARQTLMPRVAERSGKSLDAVAGVRQGIFGLSFLAGPALSGLLLAVFAPSQVLWITAAGSAGAALATLAIRVPEVRADGAETGMLGALRTVRRTPVLVKMFLVAGMSSLISAPLLNVMLPTHFAGMDRPDLLGYTMSAFAVGIVAGSTAYAALAKVSRRLAWTVALLTSGAGLLLMATLDGFWLVAIGAVVMGVGSGIVNPIFGVVLAERVPGTQLGRVMALTSATSLSAGPIGLGIASVVLSTGPLSVLAWGIAVIWALITLFGAFGSGLRDLETPVVGDDDRVREETVDAHH